MSIDVLRRRRPWQAAPIGWFGFAAPDGPSAAARVDVERLLSSMSADDAALLRLRHAEGWRIHEIAEHFGTSQRTVRRRLERLERRARAVLDVPNEVTHAS